MRLQRDCGLNEDTVEYRSAVKSVIRCQIQSLLQKLAVETGEESILISTNVSAGTYNHLGSHLGREYLEDGDEFVQVICEKFTSFCAEVHNYESSTESVSQKILSSSEKDKQQHRRLPAPKRKRCNDADDSYNTPSKQQHQCILEDEPSYKCKRNTFQTDCSPGHSDHSPDHSSTLTLETNTVGEIEKVNETPRLSWIKTEPREDESCTPFTNSPLLNGVAKSPHSSMKLSDSNSLEDPSQTSIVNRPKSLIPLANIYKKYGGNKQIKIESSPQEESKSLEKSILRSLYEQPLFKVNDPDEEPSSNGKEAGGQLQVPTLNLPLSINDECFTGSSENLVLSGYYDSDSYPMYRHKHKHLANNQKKAAAKVQDKVVVVADPIPDSGNMDGHLRTFESGGRLVYACDVCNRELSHLTSYRRHMKLHTMERPHKCPVCSKGFIRKYHCIDHLNKHHKGVGFDADTLKLTGVLNMNGENQNTATALSTSHIEDQDEYNYTLDQSIIDSSENDLSLNASQLNQSASAMLSELAKSAAKSQMSVLNLSTESDSAPENYANGDNLGGVLKTGSEDKTGSEGFHDNCEESEVTGITSQHSSDISSPSNQSEENGKIGQGTNQMDDDSDLIVGEPENGSEMRKNEVSKGIKAIVEHLKTSSRNKRKRVPPKSLTADMIN